MSTSPEYLQLVIDADRWLRYREWCETQKHEPEPDYAWILDSDGELDLVYYSEAPTPADEDWYSWVIMPVTQTLEWQQGWRTLGHTLSMDFSLLPEPVARWMSGLSG